MPKDIEDRAEAKSMLDASARQGRLKPIRLVIVDRQPIVLQGLRSILGGQQDFDVVASSGDRTSCLEALRKLTPDVALIGDTLTDLSPPEMLAIAKAEKLAARIVFFTETDVDHELAAAIAAGACSAISKYAAPAAMLQSLRLMAKSGLSLEPRDLSPKADQAEGGKIEKMLELLTERERQIARLVSEGMSNKEIARRLDVSEGTVKVHLHNIFQKLEITNRTVLATIALLQRTSGFGALALAFLAFAIADELKASEIEQGSPEDSDAGHAGGHAAYDVWKKAILQRLVLSDLGEAHRVTGRDFFTKASQATNPTAAMQALCAAEQFMGSKPWKDLGAGGSITPSLAAVLLQQTGDAQSDSDHSLSHHLPRLASEAMMHGGHATFAALAGALIYALSDTEAAAHALDQASIDVLSAGIGDDATTSLAGTADLVANHREDAAADSRLHHFDNVGQEDAHGQTAAAEGHHLQNPVGAVAHESDPGVDGRGQLMGDNVQHVAGRSSNESTSKSSDSEWDFEAGPDRLNLAAFGALAFLHLTAAAKSIPPHTLAWVYDPSTNETIVYVNATDRVLEVGDRSLMEIHLQGIVSVAEADVVHHSGGAVVADTLEQLEGALIPAVATDESGSRTDDIEGRESSGEAAGAWRAWADDGFGFRFAEARTGFGTSTKFKASNSTEATEENAGGSSVSTFGSTVAAGQGATVAVVEKLSAKSEPAKAHTGAPSAQQNEKVPPGLATADGTGPGNSGNASAPGSSNAAPQASESGNGGGKGEHQAPASKAKGAAVEKTSAPEEHGNPGHGQHSASAKAPAADAAADDPGDAHSHHASEHGAAKGATDTKPGKGVDDDAEHQATASKAKGAAAEKTSAPVEHGNSGHNHHPGSAKAVAADGAADSVGSGQSHHASEHGAAKGATDTKPGKGVDDDAEHQAPVSKAKGAAAEKTSAPVEHGNSGHNQHPGSAKAVEADGAADSVGSGQSHHASEHGAAKGATDTKPGRGLDDDAEHQAPASKAKGAAAEKTSAPAEHGNSGHGQHPASEAAADATVDTGDGGRSHPASQQGAAKPAAADTAEAESTPDKGIGNRPDASVADGDAGAKAAAEGNGDHGSAEQPGGGSAQQAAHSGAKGAETAKPVEVALARGADHEAVFRFDREAAPSELDAAIEHKKLGDLHVPRGQNNGDHMMIEAVLGAPDEPGAQHGDHGGHHGPAAHDWLV